MVVTVGKIRLTGLLFLRGDIANRLLILISVDKERRVEGSV